VATDFCCSAGCGIVASGTAPPAGLVRHWTLAGGTGPTPTAQQTTVRTAGRWAYRFNSVGSAGNQRLQRDFTASAVQTARFALYFGTLPGADTNLMQMTAGAGSPVNLRYLNSSTQLCVSLGDATQSSTKYTVTTGIWYVVEIEGDAASGTRAIVSRIRVSGEGDSQATSMSVSASITANTFTTFRIGGSIDATTVQADVYFTDILHSSTDGDYPLGDGVGIVLRPTADGTHSFNANTDFQVNDTTNISVGATDTWQQIDDVLDNTTDFLAANGTAAGEYLEWLVGTMIAVSSVKAAEVASAHHSAGTAANKQTLRLVDGGTTVDVFADADISDTSLVQQSKHYATKPSGGAWTKTTLDAAKFRWGSSFTTVDISPVPYIDALCVEVDYLPIFTGTVATAAGGGATSGSGTHTPVATTGTGATAAGGAAAAGTGTQTFTGTATATAAGAAAAATGTQVFTGSVTTAAGGAATAGTGTYTPQAITGTGATAAGGTATAASGTYTPLAITGTATTTAGGAATSGTGTYTPLAITGTAAVAAGGAATDGDGEMAGAFGGTAAAEVGGAATSGTGTYTPQAITGTGAAAAPGIASDGTGALSFTGTGAAAAGGVATDADGEVEAITEFAGVGACEFAGFMVAGEGSVAEIHLPEPEPPRTISVPLQDFEAMVKSKWGLSGPMGPRRGLSG